VIRDPAPLWCLLLASLLILGACGDAGTDEGATAAPDLAGLDATVRKGECALDGARHCSWEASWAPDR